MEPYQYESLGMFLIFILIIACIFLAWYFQHRAKARERMALIENGVDIEKLARYKSDSWSPLNIFIIILGLVAVSGIYMVFLMIDEMNAVWIVESATGEIIESNTRPLSGKVVGFRGSSINDAAYLFVFFLCMSISFFTIHYLGRKKAKNG